MARQALVPGGAYVNETGTFEALAPGFGYLNETVVNAVSVALTGHALTVSSGSLTATAQIIEALVGPVVGGGYHPSQGFYDRPRTRKEISEARRKYGLEDRYRGEEIAATILEVARMQAQSLQTEPAKQSKELSFALKIRGIEFDAIYLEALAAERQALIDAEIELRLQQIEQEEEMLLLMMIAAAACE